MHLGPSIILNKWMTGSLVMFVALLMDNVPVSKIVNILLSIQTKLEATLHLVEHIGYAPSLLQT